MKLKQGGGTGGMGPEVTVGKKDKVANALEIELFI